MPEPVHVNAFAIGALAAVHLFGINSMYGLIYRNGYYNALIQLRDHGPHVLPGSNNPILTTFTGISPLDKLLTLAGVMFANITDGSAPALSLYGFQFAGQLVSIFTVVMIEGVRHGNKKNVFRFSVLWGCLMQGLGYGFTMPLYCIAHLMSSKTAAKFSPSLLAEVRTNNIPYLETLPASMALGYLVPSFLMSIPLQSSALHQWLGGLWQGFPVWITLLQPLLNSLRVKLTKLADPSNNAESIPNHRITETMALHHAYRFAFGVSAISHLTTMALLTTRNFFPQLFSPLALDTLSFRDVFLPPMFTSNANMKNMASGIHNFFQYDQYVGSTAAIAWAIALHCNSRKEPMKLRHWLWLIAEIAGVSAIAGPGGALVCLMWNRDERVLGDDDLTKDTHTTQVAAS